MLALISIFSGDKLKLEQLDGATRNKYFTSISGKLQESSYDFDWIQCGARFKSLNADYNRGTGK